MSFCACSRLFQKLSPAIKASNSPRRFCAPGTSKKPPQMGGFLRSGSDLSFSNFEHIGPTYRRACGDSRYIPRKIFADCKAAFDVKVTRFMLCTCMGLGVRP